MRFEDKLHVVLILTGRSLEELSYDLDQVEIETGSRPTAIYIPAITLFGLPLKFASKEVRIKIKKLKAIGGAEFYE